MTDWKDKTATEQEFETIDFLLDKMFKHKTIGKDVEYFERPILIHCSAGLGRTGTLVSIFNIIEALKFTKQSEKDIHWSLKASEYHKKNYPDILEHPLRLSVFGCVRKLREQRMLMVKQQEQYCFIYNYISRWLEKNSFIYE